jgi:hypothetical protein
VVWPLDPCAEEMPEPPDSPELPDDPVLPDDPEPPKAPELDDPALPDDPVLPEVWLVPDEPLELPAELPVPLPLAAVPFVWCVAPGRAKTITPAPTRPAAPTVAVAARSLACPRRRAAAADRRFGSEYIGFPS